MPIRLTSPSRRALLLALFCCSALRAAAETVTIRVVKPDGTPAPNATVAYELPREPERTFQTFICDAEGKATVELKPLERGQFRSRGMLTAYLPGLAPGIVEPPRTIGGEGIVISLLPARALSGTVRDNRGQPVAEARVLVTYIAPTQALQLFLQSYPISEDSSPLAPRFQAVTGPDGRFTIQDLPQDGVAQLRLDDERFLSSRSWAELAKQTSPVLSTRPGASLSGCVLQDGAPVSGIRVFSQERAGRRSSGVAATTDAGGRFALTGLGAGTYTVIAKVPHERGRVATAQVMKIGEGESKSLPDMALEAGALIEGTIRDAQTGAPVPRVSVGSYGPHRPKASGFTDTVFTDKAGRYQLRVAPGDSLVVVQGAPEHLVPDNLKADGRALHLAAGETSILDFELARAATLGGTVRDEAGQPVAGALLRINQNNNWLEEHSDAKGRFEFAYLEPRDIQLRTYGMLQVESPAVVTVPAQDVVVTLKQRRTTPIRGRVLDEGGAPVEGVSVTVRTALANAFSEQKQLTTDAEGRYEWPDAPAGGQATVELAKEGWRIKQEPYTSSDRETVGVDGVLRPNPHATYMVADAILRKLPQTQ